MVNVFLWDKKRASCLRVENVRKLERFRTTWALYLGDGTVQEYKCSAYDLISVDTY